MEEKQLKESVKTYLVDEKEKSFNSKLFEELFQLKAKRGNKSEDEYKSVLAKEMGVDQSSIHNWREKLESPENLIKVQELADFWNVDYGYLLVKYYSGRRCVVHPLKGYSIESVRRVYEVLLEYLEFFSISYNCLEVTTELKKT